MGYCPMWVSLSVSVFAASQQPSAFPSACENGVLDESGCAVPPAGRWKVREHRTSPLFVALLLFQIGYGRKSPWVALESLGALLEAIFLAHMTPPTRHANSFLIFSSSGKGGQRPAARDVPAGPSSQSSVLAPLDPMPGSQVGGLSAQRSFRKRGGEAFCHDAQDLTWHCRVAAQPALS